MTKLTNEELLDKMLDPHRPMWNTGESFAAEIREERKQTRAEILQRMAAGEASPPITDSDLYVRDIDGEIVGMASEPENIPEAKSHLLAVLKQAIPSDDKIIIDHVVQAYLALGGGLNDFLAVRPFAEATPEPCADCDAARRHAYSDSTSPGFFRDRCPKHQGMIGTTPEAIVAKHQQQQEQRGQKWDCPCSYCLKARELIKRNPQATAEEDQA